MRLATQLLIDRSAKETIASQIVHYFVDALSNGRIPFGTKLPSIRDLSEQLNVSCTSIVHAYEQLTDLGYVTSKPGSGFFASYHVQLAKKSESIEMKPDSEAAFESPVEGFLLGRSTQYARQVSVALGSDFVPQTALLLDDLRASARNVFQIALQSPDPILQAFGHPVLLSHYVEEFLSRGIPVKQVRQGESPSLFVTQGLQESLAILFSALAGAKSGEQSADGNGLRPVCIEDPAPLSVHAAAMASRLPLVSVCRGFSGFDTPTNGLDLDAFLRNTRPCVFVTMPNFQDPHGGVLSPYERTKIISLASELDFFVVEIEAYPSIFYGEVFQTPIAALDGLKRSVYVFSQAHLFSPVFKSAVICAKSSLCELLAEKQVLCFGQPPLAEQLILSEFISKGHNKKHIQRLQKLFRERRDTLVAMLSRIAPKGSKWSVPIGGIYLWFEFPGGAPAHEIYQAALERGVLLQFGNLFSLSRTQPHAMRLNFASFEPVNTFRALEAVFTIWRHRSGNHW